MMSGDIVDTGEKTGTELPGGFKTVEDMYATLETMKADLADNKTRKTDMTRLEAEYKKLKDAEQKRIESEQTELEKALARIAALETEAANQTAQYNLAQQQILLERVLSKRLAGIPDSVREIARDLYASAASGKGFADEDELKALLDPVDEKLKGLQSAMTGGAKVTMTSSTSPGGGASSPASKTAAQSYLDLPYKEQVRIAREKTRR